MATGMQPAPLSTMTACGTAACATLLGLNNQEPGEVTLLLRAWGTGDRGVEARLFDIVVPELRNLAQNLVRGERPGHSMQPSALAERSLSAAGEYARTNLAETAATFMRSPRASCGGC